MTVIHDLLEQGRTAQSAVVAYNPDHTVRHIHPQAPAAVQHIEMRSFQLSAMVDTAHRSTVTPIGTAAGEVHTFSEVITAASRVAQAGAQVLMMPDASEMVPMPTGELGWKREVTHFEVIRPSAFALLADGADAPETVLPVTRVLAERETLPTYAVRHVLTRSEAREFEKGHVADTAALAMALGVARLLDKILLEAVLATSPAIFALGEPAAQGLVLADLKAIAGTEGTAAQIFDNGALRVNGIAAEFSDTISESLVGAFQRSALIVSERLTLVVERVNLRSDLTLTAFVNADVLLPTPACFWLAA